MSSNTTRLTGCSKRTFHMAMAVLLNTLVISRPTASSAPVRRPGVTGIRKLTANYASPTTLTNLVGGIDG
ncbi:hypothetical protein [Burkholderia puraquae]|uniref:hypothetical protein n=1 Tax=Burkholderia puraquae TaxID=1904757 RepID=UPI001FCA891A|nr:hypothetical protein [Burkholderia puraquae]